MKIQYASDLHLEFKANSSYLQENPLQVCGDVLILAGDIGYLGTHHYQTHPFWDWASDNYQQVLVVPGNHEFYNNYDLSKMEDGEVGEIRKNVHYYYDKVVRIDDVDIILSTLWAIISKEDAPYVEYGVTDFHRIRYGNRVLSYFDFNMEHDNCFHFIKKSVEESTAKHKVVVTHHVPSFQLCAPEFAGSWLNGAFTVEHEDYIKGSGIDYWIYGHSHRNIDKVIGSTSCVCNQLGYVHAREHLVFRFDKIIKI